MNNPRSIKQNVRPDGLPNFRNIGTLLRILMISNCLALLQAFLLASAWTDVTPRILQIATLFVPVLLTSLMMLWIIQPWLNRLPYWQGSVATMGLVTVMTLSVYYFGGELYSSSGSTSSFFDEVRYVLLSVLTCFILLLYFKVRSKILSRALHEARLQVLRARIRPHFLFNTINAVLGIVRTQPRQVETALEDMADLFRMAMSDARDLVSLQKEIKLSKQYIALEHLRMGERLQVDWQMQDLPEDALVPHLLLQPLLENAVYHGIEPLPQGGCINIVLINRGDELHITVENPCPERTDAPHRGNKVALRNIRERLDLLFDVEASYQVESGKDFYRVEITLPYVKERPQIKERT